MNLRLSLPSTIAATILIWLFAVPPASAQTQPTITTCKTISASGDYTVGTSLSGSSPCLKITANNVTIHGNDKQITSGGDSVYIQNAAHVTIDHIRADGRITVYGDSSDFALIKNVALGSEIYNVSADDLTIQDSTFASFHNEAGVSNPLERLTLQRNTIQSGAQKLVYIGNPPLSYSPSSYNCARGDYLIEDNHFISSALGGDEPLILTIRCSPYATVRRNSFVATGSAVGIYLRDQSDHHLIEDNTFDLNQGWGAFFTSSGLEASATWPEPGDPSYITFRNNTIYSRHAPGVYMQALGTGNVFTNNIIRFSGSGQLAGFENTNVLAGGGSTFTHNTVYRLDSGPVMKFVSLDTPANVVRDNIFSTGGGAMYSYDHTAAADMATAYSGSYNIFQNRSGIASFGFSPTLAAWKSASGGRDNQSVEADPKFTDPSGGDFVLLAGSPAAGTASDGTNRGAGAAVVAAPCTEDWSCDGWSACTNGDQTRTCIDLNACGTTTSKPVESQVCVGTGSGGGSGGGTGGGSGTGGGGSSGGGSGSGTGSGGGAGSGGSSGTALANDNYGQQLGLGEADLKEVTLNIIKLVLGLMTLVGVVLIIYGGMIWLTAAGNEERVDKAKRIISAAVIGLIIVLLAWAIVIFVARTTSNVTVNS